MIIYFKNKTRMLPSTPITEEVRLPKFVKKNGIQLVVKLLIML